jgi:uncharacterized protein
MERLYVKIKEIKSREEAGCFSGYASVYNNLDLNGDIILPGAFKGSINNRIELLWQHDPLSPIGKVLELKETVKGLFMRGQLVPGIAKAEEVLAMLKEGVINGLSIGFEVEDYFFKGETRYVKRAKLWEVSLVTFPANPHARIGNMGELSKKSAPLIDALIRARNALL